MWFPQSQSEKGIGSKMVINPAMFCQSSDTVLTLSGRQRQGCARGWLNWREEKDNKKKFRNMRSGGFLAAHILALEWYYSCMVTATEEMQHDVYLSVLASDIMAPMTSTLLPRPRSGKSSSSCQSVEFELVQGSSMDTPCSSLWTAKHLYSPKRLEYKLIYFTYRSTHSLSSTLLINQYIVLFQSKAHTTSWSITHGQSSIKLALCDVKHGSGSVSPLFTSSLHCNSLPSAQSNLTGFLLLNLAAFYNYLYLGLPVNRHF